jgi:hypothetical protein
MVPTVWIELIIDLVVFGRAAGPARRDVEPNSSHAELPAGAGEAAIARLDHIAMPPVHADGRSETTQRTMQANALYSAMVGAAEGETDRRGRLLMTSA